MVLHGAALSARLGGRRAGLLAGVEAGFVATLPQAATPGEQLLTDLDELNAVRALADGSVPLAIWLGNAVRLAGGRVEVTIFERALDRVREETCAQVPVPPLPADPGGTVSFFAEGPFAVISREDGGGAVMIGKSPFVLGRSPLADYSVEPFQVSREHASIRRSGGSFVVIDLESVRGTWVNGIPISRFELRDGDVVDISCGPLQVGLHATQEEAMMELARRRRAYEQARFRRTPRALEDEPPWSRGGEGAASTRSPASVVRRARRRGGEFVACLVRVQRAAVLEEVNGPRILRLIVAEIARGASHAAPQDILLAGVSGTEIAVVAPGVWSRDDCEGLLEDVRAWIPRQVEVGLEVIRFEVSVELLSMEDALRALRHEGAPRRSAWEHE